MALISGKEVSQKVKDEIKSQTKLLKDKGISVKLAVIIVGDDPASHIYVKNKKKACEYVGFESLEYALDENTSEEELLELIDKLNKDKTVNGILCQLPLPKHIDEKKIIDSISPLKDVDAFHPVNVGKIMIGDYEFLPCTPAGIMRLIESTSYDVSGKDCVIIGRSNIVGKPMAMLMLHKNATVTICHSRTKNIEEKIKNADIVIAAVGIPKFVKGDMVKDGALVIDVGINRMSDGKLCGDVDFDEVSKKASFITPVPGGVGPMTISMLMQNTLKAAKLQNNL